MFIKLNKITLYVNFIKRKYKKRICNYTHYTHRGSTFNLKQKQPYLSLYWQKYNKKNFLIKREYKKRSMKCKKKQ